MSKRVLIFRHVPFEGAGRLEDVLTARGIGFHYVDLYRPDAPAPDPAAADGLVFLGGPMSVNDPLPYLDCERAILRQAFARNQPVLGICLGSQLIAQTLGARVYRNGRKEIGWFDLEFTGAARRDPLFAGLTAPQPVFHWHSETFDLPEGAVHLASSEACRHQAFRMGTTTYALQFHAEVTPTMIQEWESQDQNCADVHELAAPLDANRHDNRMHLLANQLFSSWCNFL